MDRRYITLELKKILEKAKTPSSLDNHPWTRSQTVLDYIAKNPSLGSHGLGFQLLAALAALFREMMPGTPPRRGKRLDPRWGQFGILGALYFAPIEFGTVYPSTQLDAWGRIDEAITLFVFGSQEQKIPKKEKERYRFTGNETESAPVSTISGWHTKGLEQLTESFINREQFLSAQRNEPSIVLDPLKVEDIDGVRQVPIQASKFSGTILSRFMFLQAYFRRYQRQIWIVLLLVLLLFLGGKSWQILSLARAVQADAREMQSLSTNPGELSLESIAEVDLLLEQARDDVIQLDKTARPWLWVGDLLAWVPVYGSDLRSADHLLDLATGVVIAADETFDGLQPLIDVWQDEETFLSPSGILTILEDAQLSLTEAQLAVDRAKNARAKIDADRLSPQTSQLLEKLDSYMPILENGILAAKSAPRVLGGQEYGPQTYLVLLQNEDEIRATGGYITSVGIVSVDNAKVSSVSVVDAYDVDDPEKTAHTPPWQLSKYMRTGFWYIRDANWSPDFPTTADWVERMYVYHKSHAVDGVIAIDQEAIRILLKAIGPVEIAGTSQSISADDIIQYMRDAKSSAVDATPSNSYEQHRKDFLQPLASALLEKLEDPALSITDLAKAVIDALDSRHILIQLDDPDVSAILSNRGWNGAVKPDLGDFLMVVDSNLGFNKANAVVEEAIRYEIDLTDFENPVGRLSITHTNSALGDPGCNHMAYYNLSDYSELINRCYWDYLRVYTIEETELLGANPHQVPGEWMLRGDSIPAQVDDLSNNYIMPERIPDVRVFGTLFVVPKGETLVTRFDFRLPSSIMTKSDEGFLVYGLKVQKQPGTKAHTLELTAKLPVGFELVEANPEGEFDTNSWHFVGTLAKDVNVVLVFSLP